MRYIFFSLLLLFGVGTTGHICAQSTDSLTSVSQIDSLLEILSKGKQIETTTLTIRDINFDLDSDTLFALDQPFLEKIALLLSRTINISLLITGHTDSQGPESYNQALSERRAEAVKQYLVARIPEDMQGEGRIEILGRGETQPIADNKTAEGRRLNRRVDFTVIVQPVERIQNLIILCKGDTLGVKIDTITEQVIYYYDFLKEGRQEIDIREVCKIDTREIIHEEPEPVDTPRSYCERFGSRSFHKGAHIVQVGGELLHNLDEQSYFGNLSYDDGFSPMGVSLTYEYGLTCNIGVGLSLAGRRWGDGNRTISYGSITGRLVFHIPVNRHLDPYIGITGTYAGTRGQFRTQEPETDRAGGIDPLIGLRVYLKDQWGFVGEAGSGDISFFRLGAFFMFP